MAWLDPGNEAETIEARVCGNVLNPRKTAQPGQLNETESPGIKPILSPHDVPTISPYNMA